MHGGGGYSEAPTSPDPEVDAGSLAPSSSDRGAASATDAVNPVNPVRQSDWDHDSSLMCYADQGRGLRCRWELSTNRRLRMRTSNHDLLKTFSASFATVETILGVLG